MQQEDSPKCWASYTKGVWIVGKAKKHIATDAVVALDLLSLLGLNSESRIGWIGRTSPLGPLRDRPYNNCFTFSKAV